MDNPDWNIADAAPKNLNEDGTPKQRKGMTPDLRNCPACGEPGPHFVPPSLGEEGFFMCEAKKNQAQTSEPETFVIGDPRFVKMLEQLNRALASPYSEEKEQLMTYVRDKLAHLAGQPAPWREGIEEESPSTEKMQDRWTQCCPYCGTTHLGKNFIKTDVTCVQCNTIFNRSEIITVAQYKNKSRTPLPDGGVSDKGWTLCCPHCRGMTFKDWKYNESTCTKCGVRVHIDSLVKVDDQEQEEAPNTEAANDAPALNDIMPYALNLITGAMKSDDDLAWAWHCNIAISSMDEGMDREPANRAAARFMFTAFKMKAEEYAPKSDVHMFLPPLPDHVECPTCMTNDHLRRQDHRYVLCTSCQNRWAIETGLYYPPVTRIEDALHYVQSDDAPATMTGPLNAEPPPAPCPPTHHLKCNNCETDLELIGPANTLVGRQGIDYWCPRCLQAYMIPQSLHDHHLKKKTIKGNTL